MESAEDAQADTMFLQVLVSVCQSILCARTTILSENAQIVIKVIQFSKESALFHVHPTPTAKPSLQTDAQNASKGTSTVQAKEFANSSILYVRNLI